MTWTSAGPPRTIGGYRILDRIGEGGMGVVHLAESPSGRRVAMKVLRPHVVGDDEGRRRLAREVASLRHVHSPHVAEVLDADPWGETPYVVTRFVPGHSLQETVERAGPLGRADLGHLARRLLDAVRDVHAAGVLHRDLKPTNVVMEGRSPILIDFGLARLAEDPRLTMTGWLLGTPGYVAPEMLFGEPATPATDVHGWAATVAFAATGRPPYGRGHAMAVLDRTRHGDHDLDGTPDDLRPLLARCLATEPAERPGVDEVAEELAALATRDVVTRALHADGPDGAPAGAPAAEPSPTMPWPLMPRDGDPPTEALQARPEPGTRLLPDQPARQDPPTQLLPPVQQPAAAPVRPMGPAPLRHPAAAPYGGPAAPHSAPAPYPQPSGPPYVAQPSRPQARDPYRALGGAERACRALLLVSVAALVAATFRAAPYLSLAGAAVGVLLLRAGSRVQQRTWRRRTSRGRRWSDVPTGVLSFPWHLLCALGGTLVLVAFAAMLAALAVAALMMAGEPVRHAVAGGGCVLAAILWWGPGGGRVRHCLGGLATTTVKRSAVGWVVAVMLAVLAGATWLVATSSAVDWSPAGGPPWQQLRELVPSDVPVPMPSGW